MIGWNFRCTRVQKRETRSSKLKSEERMEIQIQGIPAFRDFTIRDPRYFVILFLASFHDFEEKNPYL